MIILDSSHDYFHMIDDHGGYEWTYYDGFSEDRSLGFTAIFFRGVPMSPNYSRAIERGEGNPADHLACAFNLYHEGKSIASWLVEGEGEQSISGGVDDDIDLGQMKLYRHAAPDGTLVVRIALNGRTPMVRHHVEGIISLSFPPFSVGSAVTGTLDRTISSHYWVPAAPSGTFEAAIDFKPVLGSNRSLRFSGEAYHDRNFGFEPILDENVDWFWGRVHGPRETLIFFHVADREDGERSGVSSDLRLTHALLVADNQILNVADDLKIQADYAQHWATLPYPAHLSGRADLQSDAPLDLSVVSSNLLESGPFYHRSSATIKYSWGESRGEGIGTLEYLRPDRLGIAFFRPFIRFRARRVRGGTFS